MKIEQCRRTKDQGWTPAPSGQLHDAAQLVLLFGNRDLIADPAIIQEAQQAYPKAYVAGCSTAGEICGTLVSDDALVMTALYFEKSLMQTASVQISHMEESAQIGERLVQGLPKQELAHVFVLSEGLNINGSELVTGIVRHLPPHVAVTGGLSGDGDRFKETFVIADGRPLKNTVVALGIYGSGIKVGYSSLGGWDPFGPDRLVTRSKNNILYELDGESALKLYKQYLGEYADKLPASGLLFPLSLRREDGADWIVRTILAVNEQEQSMTFAGDIPEGSSVRLMKASLEGLVDGAIGAAQGCRKACPDNEPDFAILISCVGRKMVLKQRVEEEVEGVQEVLGSRTILTGFYSYGEICPFVRGAKSELHNQTMTITTFSER
ncbi:MAG: FIST C-terminal domain-containing protein [Candidatus Omnitrophica bacterium]|nr:FIST C-terminal domain-containing protein [Candidatus Omnitrophota bacterium]